MHGKLVRYFLLVLLCYFDALKFLNFVDLAANVGLFFVVINDVTHTDCLSNSLTIVFNITILTVSIRYVSYCSFISRSAKGMDTCLFVCFVLFNGTLAL